MFRVVKSALPVVARAQFVPAQRTFWGLPSRTVNRMIRDMDRQMDHFDSFFRYSPLMQMLPRSMPLEAAETSGNTYRINLDVSSFKPEDIKVSLKDRVLTIDAKMEKKSEDGSRFYQEMSRLYTLPESVEVSNLKSLLSNEGVLCIEAPISGEVEKPKEIPISRTEEIAAK
ncbi:heat shock protein hsp-16.2-like [Neocloeon triangulifer]|uniref:heat shock protein hsp-16.2-like n=1 Tax=Neocloeon triangulifer TaxID=2078957 RepID=UPI00286F53B9|nr:heat shock protein hsp-16.2-like [Neocloeon triangulifer]